MQSFATGQNERDMQPLDKKKALKLLIKHLKIMFELKFYKTMTIQMLLYRGEYLAVSSKQRSTT